MKKLLLGTTNKGKIRELSQFLSDLPLQLISLNDVAITIEPEESGKSYEENSQIKALFYSKKTQLPTVADDGGLEICALNGQPGLRSHRWLGPNTTEADIVKKMQTLAKSLPDDNRQAVFKTCVSLAFPDGSVTSFNEEVAGIIAKEPSMNYEKGFPYRSFFFLPKLNKFYFESEFSPLELQQYNHRYKAVQQLRVLLKKKLL